MALPPEITDEHIEIVCDCNNDALEDLLCGIDDGGMDDYIGEIAGRIGVDLGLSEEQTEELLQRLAWKLVLLPPQS